MTMVSEWWITSRQMSRGLHERARKEGHLAFPNEATETYPVVSNHSSGSFRSRIRTVFEQGADRGDTRLSDLLTLQEKLLVDLRRVTQELEKHLQESAPDEQQSR